MTGVKAISLISRNPALSRQRFHLHWALVHRAHALRLAPILRYVQFHPEQGGLAPFPEGRADGVAQVWYADLAAAASMRTDPLWSTVIAPDEAYFLDGTSTSTLTAEAVVVDGPEVTADRSLTKGMIVLARAVGQRHADVAAWCAARLPGLVTANVDGLSRCVLSLPVPQRYTDTDPAFDAALELWPRNPHTPECAPLDLHSLAAALRDSPLDLDRTVSLVGAEFRCR